MIVALATAIRWRIMEVGMGFRASDTLLRAVELELFTRLEESGPQTIGQLRRALGLHEGTARDFLDQLVDLEFLEREGSYYFNSDEASMFLDNRSANYVGGILALANHRLLGFWNDLTNGLSPQIPDTDTTTGGPDFSKLYTDPERLADFLASMTCVSRGANQTIARRFPWEDYSTWLDLGCAQGDLMVQVVLANPHIRASGIDLPEVETSFDAYVEAHGVSEHVTFIPGDFWEAPLPSVDVITMGRILSKWGLERRRWLLERTYEALNENGVLIVCESNLDSHRPDKSIELLESLNMLIETKERNNAFTSSECIAWMQEAGFGRCRVQHLVGANAMIAAYK